MKTKLFFALLLVFAFSAPTAFASKSDAVKSDKIENKLSEAEVTRLTKRVEEIRDMDKSDMTIKEKRELRKELKTTKENLKKDGGYIYISAGTLILIIILIILLV